MSRPNKKNSGKFNAYSPSSSMAQNTSNAAAGQPQKNSGRPKSFFEDRKLYSIMIYTVLHDRWDEIAPHGESFTGYINRLIKDDLMAKGKLTQEEYDKYI